jgi:plasmid stabilization system protein ParE
MAHPIIWLPEAAEDLQQIFDFVGQTSPAYSGSVIGRILDAVENLQQFPRMGHGVTEIRIKGVALSRVGGPALPGGLPAPGGPGRHPRGDPRRTAPS